MPLQFYSDGTTAAKRTSTVDMCETLYCKLAPEANWFAILDAGASCAISIAHDPELWAERMWKEAKV